MAAATVAATTAASVVAAVPVTKAAATTTMSHWRHRLLQLWRMKSLPLFFSHFHFELPTVWWWFIRVNYLPRQVEYYRLCTVECCTSCTSSYCLFLIQLFTKLNKATPTMREAKRIVKVMAVCIHVVSAESIAFLFLLVFFLLFPPFYIFFVSRSITAICWLSILGPLALHRKPPFSRWAPSLSTCQLHSSLLLVLLSGGESLSQ